MEDILATYAAFVDDVQANYAVLCQDDIHQTLGEDSDRRNTDIWLHREHPCRHPSHEEFQRRWYYIEFSKQGF